MKEIAVIRADYYADGTVIPLLITFPDGQSEVISSVKRIIREVDCKRYTIHCTTPARDLILCFQNSRWEIKKCGV